MSIGVKFDLMSTQSQSVGVSPRSVFPHKILLVNIIIIKVLIHIIQNDLTTNKKQKAGKVLILVKMIDYIFIGILILKKIKEYL